MVKTWFITGTSSGFGREWAIAALERGDRVAATARNIDQLQGLVERYGTSVLVVRLDVTDRAAALAAVQEAADHFGSLDVVINNAGYGHFGMIEELSEQDIRTQMESQALIRLTGSPGDRGPAHRIPVTTPCARTPPPLGT